MKRALILLVALVILIPCCAAAGGVDLKSLSNEELLSLHQQVSDELFARGKSAEIPAGEYIIGKHIPAGEYKIELLKPGDFSVSVVTLYKDANGSSLDAMYSVSKESPSVGRIVLKDGGSMQVNGSTLKMTKIDGVAFTFQ